MKMPFGKYVGLDIEDLPRSYLRWCLDNLSWMDSWLEDEMEHVLRTGKSKEQSRREQTFADEDEGEDEEDDDPEYEEVPDHEPEPETVKQPPSVSRTMILLNQAYRELCLRWHPDRGGSTEIMQGINAFHERMRQLLEEESC